MKRGDRTILFVCTGNACRSQMAEGFAREMLSGWRVLSAGTIASGVHPLAIAVMGEEGIDISDQYSKTVDDIPAREVDHVVTLCGDARERCPNFPNAKGNEHWPVEDPIYYTGTGAEMDAFRKARDDIRRRMEGLVERIGG